MPYLSVWRRPNNGTSIPFPRQKGGGTEETLEYTWYKANAYHVPGSYVYQDISNRYVEKVQAPYTPVWRRP